MLLSSWCNEKRSVIVLFYESVLLGHAHASAIHDAIIDAFAIDGIKLKHLLMLGRDNPNVNISLENLIEEEMKKVESHLLKIGRCNLHVVHSGFKAGWMYFL
ncbi:unnamed protein product [Didymodactylos carnosus]|uniref:Uncharacterized protein n=1 Tax=Didymodactylos carnosus TaxID=1234261 RepID=A0A814V1C5_9BILA|nr:unnamed protein product [Didymodactylos carnosus]CAF3946283.1 unnamed protein product [Didymodactylos carnosus]